MGSKTWVANHRDVTSLIKRMEDLNADFTSTTDKLDEKEVKRRVELQGYAQCLILA